MLCQGYSLMKIQIQLYSSRSQICKLLLEKGTNFTSYFNIFYIRNKILKNNALTLEKFISKICPKNS